MYKNYFFLNRFAAEASSEIKSFTAVSAFTQERDKLYIRLSNGAEEIFLEISVNPGFPYINLRNSFNRAKKNTIDFFSSYFPSRFISFQIAENDRILKLNFSSASVYFVIRGKYTNIHLVDDDKNILSFKKTSEVEENDFLNEIAQASFTSSYNIPEIIVRDSNFKESIKKNYPIIGNEIILETELRAGETDFQSKAGMLQNIIIEIASERPAVFIDEEQSQIHLAVNTFRIFPFTKKKLFDSLPDALNFFISRKHSFESAELKEKIIRKHLDRVLKKLSDKLNNLKSRIEKGSKEDEYNRIGNLLLINRHSIKKGMNIIEITNIYNEEEKIKIKLDAKLSPQKNIDLYFDKAKSERINFEKSKQLFESAKKEYDRLNRIEEKLKTANNPEDHKIIMKELHIKENTNEPGKEDIRDKFKQYIISGKYNLYLGRDSRNNDLLTTKFAKQNDFWFHARSVSGSHAVLRVDNTKETVPKDVLKKAASITAYHSKSKTAGLAPVSYTLKKYVVKKKGMEPGKVALMKEDVLIVKPEIPPDCEYVIK